MSFVSGEAASVSSLAGLLRGRARAQADRTAYIFLPDGERDEQTVTYGELDRQARCVAAELQRREATDRPVVLCYPPGLDYIGAFLGCAYAGAVAVPAYPPEASRLQRTLPRLSAMIGDSGARLVLAPTRLAAEVSGFLRSAATVVPLDPGEAGGEEGWQEVPVSRESLAFLMYTSGSTGRPKGAMISNGNVLHNLGQFPGFAGRPCEAFVSWLPFFHDLGLMMGMLHPLYRGKPGILLPPLAFAQRPLRWIEAISRYGATTTGGPNFAYDLCAAKSTPAERAALDLSAWNLALNGSEAVRQGTIDRFTAAFRGCGFQPETFYCSYGLAEATATVTGDASPVDPVYLWLERSEAERGRAVVAAEPRGMPLVGCGPGLADQEIAIVDPETRRRRQPGEIGEIWVKGPSVAQGFWNRPEETEALLRARLADTAEGPYLRTGDLGFLHDGELFLTGRLKDLVIIRGINYHPEDIELTVEGCHPAVRRGCGAAFSVDTGEGERLVVVQEVRPANAGSPDEVVAAIRAAVADEHGIEVGGVALIKPGTIPKTSSGKIQRGECRELFLHERLETIGSWSGGGSPRAAEAGRPAAGGEAPGQARIEAWLVSYLTREVGVPPGAIDVRDPFVQFGLSSLGAVSMVAEIESWLGRRLPPSLVWDHPSIEALARHLAGRSEPRRAGSAVAPGEEEPIAIVGLGCRFPGAGSLSGFWDLLRRGGDAITEIPPSRWDIEAYYDPDPAAPGKMVTRWGGFLDDLDRFDAAFFGLSPREMVHLDPQQRLVLEAAWEALEDAGIPPLQLAGSRTGVFLASLSNDYGVILFERYADRVEAYTGTGNASTMKPNRLSYFLDLRGPSLSVDTACSGSLVALQLACDSLRRGECPLALAGGVNVILRPDGNLFFSKAGALSPDGRCKPFDARANGMVRSEGAGVLVLKPLSRALADHDDVYAVILGGAVNQDGRSNGVMAPNGPAQEAVLTEAYRRAGIEPSQVQYIEAHGTGTKLGDLVEANALGRVLAPGRQPGSRCALGSVKSNIGHAEAAAGAAGIIKVALALKHRLLPATVHFESPNPLIPFGELPLQVQRELGSWPAPQERLVAGVSSFGIGGTNAHIVLAEAPQAEPSQDGAGDEGPCLLPISARSGEALRQLARSFRDRLAEDADPARTCRSAAVHRSHLEHRLAVVAVEREELLSRLDAFLAGDGGSRSASLAAGRLPKIAMVFSGQGSHACRMGWRLFGREAAFTATLARCDELVRQRAGWSLLAELEADEERCRFDGDTSIAQPAVFAVQVALAGLWRAWGIVPDTVVGQSLGEVAAACVCGALSLEDAMDVVLHRSRLMKRVAGEGATALVGLSTAEAELALAGFEGQLWLAGSSSPRGSVVAGDPDAVHRLVTSLERRKIFARLLRGIDIAFHTPRMEPLARELASALADLRPGAAAIPLVSTVTGRPLPGEEMGPEHWARNLAQPFVLSRAVEALAASGHEIFLEVGGHPVLSTSIREGLEALGRRALVLPTLRRGEEERATLLAALAELYTAGCAVSWRAVHPRPEKPAPLPSYPWQKQRFWFDQLGEPSTGAAIAASPGSAHPLLAHHVEVAGAAGRHLWEKDLGARSLHWLDDHRVQNAVVLPAAAYLEMALSAAAGVLGSAAREVESASFSAPFVLTDTGERRIQLSLAPAGAAGWRFEVHGRPAAAETAAPWVLHAAGTLRLEGEERPQARLALTELRQRLTESVESHDHYRTLRLLGLDYGPSFQAVAQMQRGAGEALARLRLPDGLRSEAASYALHPVLLDAAFQTVAAAQGSPEPDRDTFVPTGVRRLCLLGRPPLELWCHAVLRAAEEDADRREADIVLADESGLAVATIEGLCLQRLSGARKPADSLLYRLGWVRKEAGAEAETAPEGSWILFADSRGVAERLAGRLAAQGQPCVLVERGEAYQVDEGGARIVLDPRDPEHFRRLLGDTLGGERPPCRGIVHLWSLDAPVELSAAALDEALAGGAGSILLLLQALAWSDWNRVVDLAAGTQWHQLPPVRVVTRGGQAVLEGEPAAALQAPVWGLGRVAALEHPEIWRGTLDLEPAGDDEEAAELLAAELAAEGTDDRVAWRAGLRFVPRIERVPAPLRLPHEEASPRFRPDASYLITGGLGGLGLAVAHWMVERGARRLILGSRSALPPREQWSELPSGTPAADRVDAVRGLEALGASIHAVELDVADRDRLGEFLDRFHREGWPPIRGVVHAAGALSDQLLARVTPEAFATVWRPKALGALLLHERLGGELDFFVLFSSLTSVVGSFGQASYAAANAFLDGLAHQRRAAGMPAVSLDWGPWSEVGMAARQALEARHAEGGIQAISPAEGVAALADAFDLDEPQMIVVRADWRLWARAMGADPRSALLSALLDGGAGARSDFAAGAAEEAALAQLLAGAGPEELPALVESQVAALVAGVLRCDPAQIDRRQPLASLGIDSIMTTEIRNQIDNRFGVMLPFGEIMAGGSMAELAASIRERIQIPVTVLPRIDSASELEYSGRSVPSRPVDETFR